MSLSDDHIENLKRGLYSRGAEGRPPVREHELGGRVGGGNFSWEKPKLDVPPTRNRPFWGLRFLKLAAVLFLGSLLYATYAFFVGSNQISSSNIDITVTGPVAVGSGEAITLAIKIKNMNSAALEVADLLVEYPEGTRSANSLSSELPRFREELGDLEPGGEAEKSVSAMLFGEERSALDIGITLEYRVPGSGAVFFKKVSYPVTISSAPVVLRVEGPSEVGSGDDLSLDVTVSANTGEGVRGTLLKVNYPPGFVFSSATPPPVLLNNVFRVGDLEPLKERVITIRGKLSGEDGGKRTFRLEFGLPRSDNDRAIGTLLSSASETIDIKKSLLSIALSVNDNGSEGSAASGAESRVEIVISNNLPVRVSGLQTTLNLSGAALNKNSVRPVSGFYNSQSNTVTWSRASGAPDLLDPGDSFTLTLNLSSLGREAILALLRPEILFAVSSSGVRESEEAEKITSSASGRLRIESDVTFGAEILGHSGPLQNSGPLPPEVGKETTYTVVLSLTNSSNNLNSTVVSATLPLYVSFTGESSPDESLSFNSSTRKVSWNAGVIEAGSGISRAKREAYFKIGFTPNVGQAGTAPSLVEGIKLTATDSFTGAAINISEPALSTRLPSDPGAKPGEEIVSP